jgi:hypothetical protein
LGRAPVFCPPWRFDRPSFYGFVRAYVTSRIS